MNEPSSKPAPSSPALLAEIDQSCRLPLLLLLLSALAWLAAGSVLALIASVQLHAPAFFGNCPFFTHGHVKPAANNALIFGFASQAGIAVALWLFCRLGRTPLFRPLAVAIAAIFWNLGVTAGVVGIFAGDSTGFEWLEMPRYASSILFAAYAAFGVCALITFKLRREAVLYPSQWYLLAAFFWFPWIYSAAQMLLVIHPVRGAMQAAVNYWFVGNFFNLWLAPLGLAVIFYFVPKILERPLHSRPLALFGFWTLAIFGSWAGTHPGAPLPAWVNSISSAASVLLLIPAVAVALNLGRTMAGIAPGQKPTRTCLFVSSAALGYLLAVVIGACAALCPIMEFTHFAAAQSQLMIFGFFALAVAGAVYYIVPRLTQREFPSAGLVKLHLYGGGLGAAISAAALIIAGFMQGRGLNNPATPFLDVAASIKPLLLLNTLGVALLALAALAFFGNFVWLLAKAARECCAQCCGCNKSESSDVKLNPAEARR